MLLINLIIIVYLLSHFILDIPVLIAHTVIIPENCIINFFLNFLL